MKLKAAILRFDRQLAANGRSGHTRAAYRRDLRVLAGWSGGNPELGRVTPDDLARFLTSDAVLLAPSGQPRAAISINRTKSALRSFFGFCLESWYIRENPARLIRSSPAAVKAPAALTEGEIHRLRDAIGRNGSPLAHRDRLILELLLGTGIRLGSLVALNLADTDLRTGTLRIRLKGGTEGRVFLNPALRRDAANASKKVPHKPPVALTRRFFGPAQADGWVPGKSSCGSPSCAGKQGWTARCRFTPSATPSPAGSTRRPATCTWSSGRSGTGRLRRRRSMRGCRIKHFAGR